jgi:hypothetical protein
LNTLPRVIVESPFAGKGDSRIAENLYNKAYLAACLYDCYKRGEAPMASHAIGPLALDDENTEHRELGIQAGFAWRSAAEKTVVYIDLGMSRGMKYGIQHAIEIGCPIERRRLGPPWSEQATCPGCKEVLPGNLKAVLLDRRSFVHSCGTTVGPTDWATR